MDALGSAPRMTLDHALEILALVFALAGLAAVITEILGHDPRLLGEIVTDVRAMARPERGPGRGGADR